MTPISQRQQHTILVAQAETVGALAVVRSLGCAGYRVIATSPSSTAIARHSRFSSAFLQTPATEMVADWLGRLVNREGISVIIPSESLLLAIRPNIGEFEGLLPYRDGENAIRGLSKWHLFTSTSAVGAGTFLALQRPFEASTRILERLGEHVRWPLFLKCDGVHSPVGASSTVVAVRSPDELAVVLARVEESYDRVIVQAFTPGFGVGACFVRWHGRILARYAHRRIHEVPHWGGASSLRATLAHPGILADAGSRLEAMDFDGPAMFEYRTDPLTGHYVLMEMNGRFWGSLHLGLLAGVDMPRLLVDAMLGFAAESEPMARPTTARLLVPGEIDHVISVLGDREVGLGPKMYSLLDLAVRSVDPRVKSDLFGFHDRSPGFYAGRAYALALVRSVASYLGHRRLESA